MQNLLHGPPLSYCYRSCSVLPFSYDNYQQRDSDLARRQLVYYCGKSSNADRSKVYGSSVLPRKFCLAFFMFRDPYAFEIQFECHPDGLSKCSSDEPQRCMNSILSYPIILKHRLETTSKRWLYLTKAQKRMVVYLDRGSRCTLVLVLYIS